MVLFLFFKLDLSLMAKISSTFLGFAKMPWFEGIENYLNDFFADKKLISMTTAGYKHGHTPYVVYIIYWEPLETE